MAQFFVARLQALIELYGPFQDIHARSIAMRRELLDKQKASAPSSAATDSAAAVADGAPTVGPSAESLATPH